MSTVTLAEAQAELPGLVHRLALGEEVVLTENGSVVARLIGERRSDWQRPGPGLCKGMMTILAADDEHLEDFAEYMP